MKKLVAVALLTTLVTLNASDLWTSRDVVTKEYFSDVAFRAKTDQHIAPGWILGSKPFATIFGGWEYIPVFQFGSARLEIGNVPTSICPKIDLNTPISLKLHQ